MDNWMRDAKRVVRFWSDERLDAELAEAKERADWGDEDDATWLRLLLAEQARRDEYGG